MSKLLDLVKGTPSYVLTGKALIDNPDLAKAKYTRREAKSGGGYRYFYDNHGQAGKNYSVHKEGSKWRSTYHDGDTDHPVSKTGSHDKHPATGSVIGAEHKSKAEAERAISRHSDRQHHAADHGPLNNSNAIGHIRNQMARMPRSQMGARTAAGNKMLQAIEAGTSQAEVLAASGLDAEAAKQVYDGLKAFASKYVAAGSVKKAGDNPDLVKGGGEGSRGGHVIGHTSSGKAIYASHAGNFKEHTKGWSSTDHDDAALRHEKQADKHHRGRTAAMAAAFEAANKGDHAADKKHRAAGNEHQRARDYHHDAMNAHDQHAAAALRAEDTKAGLNRYGSHEAGWEVFSPLMPTSSAAEAAHGATYTSEHVKKAGDNPDLVKGGGPFIGPKGGKWADSKHTIAWKEGKPPSKQRKHAHAGTNKGWHNDHKNTTADEHRDLAGRHHKLALEASSARNKLSVRSGSNTHFEHGYDSDHHRAMADAHATMARAKDSYGGPEKYDISRVSSHLSDARAHQRNHEDSKAASAALRPPADAKGNAATMGKTGSGNPLEFLSDANFRDHTHGWTASDHSDAAREHSARMDHQYALSDDAQSKGDFEEGARRNAAGRYHKEMAEAHEIKSRNPRKLVTPKTKRKDAKLAHSLSVPGGSMADKSAVPDGHHQIAQADGPRTVKTSHKSGLYHVHSLKGLHSVTHGPSGMSAGHFKTKAKAVAAAKHMHAVAGDAGSDAKFGKNPSKAALTRMANAHRTIP